MILPTTVRHDRRLGDKAKLLYVEINANLNNQGFCIKTNDFFADVMGINKRTVVRALNELILYGHVRTSNKSPRKLYIQAGAPVLEPVEKPKPSVAEDIINEWESNARVTVNNKKDCIKALDKLLQQRSEAEIRRALSSRYDFLFSNPLFDWTDYMNLLEILDAPSIDKWIKLGK